MYYDKEILNFNESNNGIIFNKLNIINSSLGYLVSLLDNFTNIKIKLVEIIKDIDIIANDIKNNTSNFDIRRKQLILNWINDYNIDKYLPLGCKQSCYALNISYNIDLLLKDLSNDYQDYLYYTSLYLKQIFNEINELKGVSVLK